VWFVSGHRFSDAAFLGGAALQRCDNRIVLTAALAAEVRALENIIAAASSGADWSS
jgi:hypothetical protein